ncbi:uncharacterized protein [Dysidea avara]|uniref:uncharacterized protein isoform X3 n=1 Tax=Dysidea avara TaxID=196820 RepID=UPI00332EE8C6
MTEVACTRMLAEGAVVISQVQNKDDTPTMKDLNRYVTKKYAADWKDIGLELGLKLRMLNIIEKDHPQQSVACFQETLDNWLESSPNPTWKTLEVVLTNVARQHLDLDPVDDVHSFPSNQEFPSVVTNDTSHKIAGTLFDTRKSTTPPLHTEHMRQTAVIQHKMASITVCNDDGDMRIRSHSEENLAAQNGLHHDHGRSSPTVKSGNANEMLQHHSDDHIQLPPLVMQRQLSEFPLDQSVITLGKDGYYLEDRDYNVVAGVGGASKCNRVSDTVKGTQFIVKKSTNTDDSRQDLIRESRILQEITHENVIRFYGFVEDYHDRDLTFNIFLEYGEETCGDIHYLFCQSEDKEDFSGNIVLIMLYVQQLLYAANYLRQDLGIIHCDITGKNLVVCNGGYKVKLIDFGAAVKVGGGPPVRGGCYSSSFAAPEVNRGIPVMFSADIWSIMCVAVEMVTSDWPWKFNSETTISHEIILFKIGFYEDHQITDIIEFDDYRDKYNYYQQHCEMYGELVDMWNMVFCKDSSSRPSASDLLSMRWMRKMEHDGERILRELVGDKDLDILSVSEQRRIAYQLALRDGKAEVSNFRLLVFGPENSGKTCLVSTLFGESFQDNPATQGADVNIGTIYTTNWCKCSAEEMAEKLHVRFWHNMNVTAIPIIEHVRVANLQSESVNQTEGISEDKLTTFSEPATPTKVQMPEVNEEEIQEAEKIRINDEKEFTAVVWDCAGQEKYITTHTVFIRRNNLVFVVFKASCNLFGCVEARLGDQNSSPKVTHFKVIHYWLQSVTSVRRDPGGGDHMSEFLPTVVLVATHIDEITGDVEEAKSVIITQLAKELEGKSYAKHLAGNHDEKGLLYALRKFCIFLSNKSEFRNSKTISRLKEIVLLVTAPTMKEKHPLVYIRIEKKLLSLQEEVITTAKFHEIAMESGFMADADSSEMKGALNHFHQMGIVLHFPSIDSLKELVFLTPQWLEKLYAYLIIAHPYKPTGDDKDHSYSCLVQDGILLESFLIHMLEMFNKQQQVISCKISFAQAVDYLVRFGFIAKINISTDFLEESHPFLECEEEEQIYIVPTQLPEYKGDKKLSFVDDQANWTIHFVFSTGFVPLNIFHKMISTCIDWNSSRMKDIAWLKKYEIMMVLDHGQFYRVTICEEHTSIQLDIILEKYVGEDSSENRKQLVNFFQSKLNQICKDWIPACPKVKAFIPCPFCNDLHILYKSLSKESLRLVCSTIKKPIPSGYYQNIFCCEGTKKTDQASVCEDYLNDRDRVTYAGLVEKLKDVNNWYELGMYLLPRGNTEQLANIHKSNEGNVRECKKALLIKYLEVGDRSWNTVTLALVKIGHKELATIITQSLGLEQPLLSKDSYHISEGCQSPEYKVFIDYFSTLVDTLPATDLCHYFVSDRVITLADHQEVVRSSTPQRAATILLDRVSCQIQDDDSTVFTKMLLIMKHHGIATAKSVSEEITAKLLGVKCKSGNSSQAEAEYQARSLAAAPPNTDNLDAHCIAIYT